MSAPEPVVDLQDLPAHVREAVRVARSGGDITVTDGGEVLGSLQFRRHVLEGTLLPAASGAGDGEDPQADAPHGDGVLVIAAAMELPAALRARLSAEYGPDAIVLDIREAPRTADVVLTHPVSPMLVANLRSMFPRARVVVTEIVDEEFGVRYAGDVTRMLEAGAETYLPPADVGTLAGALRAHLESGTGPALGPGVRRDPDRPELGEHTGT